jgi:hypothetical protein
MTKAGGRFSILDRSIFSGLWTQRKKVEKGGFQKVREL